MKKFLLVLVLFVVSISCILVGYTSFRLLAPVDPTSTEKKIFVVEKGITPLRLSQSLQDQGLIRNAEVFYWYGKMMRKWPLLKAGEYDLSASQTSKEILGKLISGLGLQRVLLVKEGINMYEVADLFDSQKIAPKAQFLSRMKDPNFIATLGIPGPTPTNLEGYLFPETYYYTKTTPLDEIIRGMVKKSIATYQEVIEPYAANSGLTGAQLLTLASMVEKETGAPVERPLIAGVFFNRLKKGMKLQSDPTTIYGIWHRYKGNIHRSDLLEPSPYNTYTIPALPIGPIANPGREAMLAVTQPATHEFLYFVSRNDGTHIFSKTYEEHSRAVSAFQMNAKAREGKSWRDLNKKKNESASP
jgi:UPF0755 protein